MGTFVNTYVETKLKVIHFKSFGTSIVMHQLWKYLICNIILTTRKIV